MEDLLLKPEFFQKHYNCNFYSIDMVPLEERQHRLVGVLFLIGYAFFTPLYIICVWAMCSRANRQHTTYRIMILLGIIHIIGLQETGLINGLFAMQGIVYCSSPTFVYVTSLLASGTWTSSSILSIILGLNRCCMLYNRSLHEFLFKGKRIIPWMVVPILYAFWIDVFTTGIIYNGIYVAFFFNPHQGYFDDPDGFYHSTPNRIHNICVCVFELSIYTVLIILYKRSSKGASTEIKKKAKYDRQIYVQVILVGLTSFIASGVYFILMSFPVPISLSLTGTAFFHVSQGMPAIVYLTFNKTIQNTLSRQFKARGLFMHSSSMGRNTTQVQQIQQVRVKSGDFS